MTWDDLPVVYCTVAVTGVGMDDDWVWVPRGEGRASGAQGAREQSTVLSDCVLHRAALHCGIVPTALY